MAWKQYTAQGQEKVLSAASPLAPMTPISDTILSGTGTFDVTIPQTYEHLRLVLQARGDTAAANTQAQIRFNGDSAGNYDWQSGYFHASTAGAEESYGATGGSLANVNASTAIANVAGLSYCDIPNYRGTTFQKNYTAMGAFKNNTTTDSIGLRPIAGFWRSTAAINRIQVLPSAGSFIAGSRLTVYGFGIVTANGVGIGAFLPAGYSTTLPGSPADGQEHILVDSTTSPTYQWRFRYNASSASSYKWEFVGGSPARADVETTEFTSSTSFVDLATTQWITAPRAGVYRMEFGGTYSHAGAAGTVISVAVDSLQVVMHSKIANYLESFSRIVENGAVTASEVLKMQFKNADGATSTFRERYFHITPVRVS